MNSTKNKKETHAEIMEKITEKYENSLFFQLNSNAKYYNRLFEKFFKELYIEVNGLEHLALTVISQTENCCQRDLARILVKDRANTGKIVNVLEKKGLINIELKQKNNRPAKILTLTKKGEKINEEVHQIILPLITKIYTEIDIKEIEQTKQTLNKLRKAVEKNIKIDI